MWGVNIYYSEKLAVFFCGVKFQLEYGYAIVDRADGVYPGNMFFVDYKSQAVVFSGV